MSPATILAIISVLASIIQDTPQAIAVFDAVKAMLASGAEPTAAQWAALNAMLVVDHAAVQR